MEIKCSNFNEMVSLLKEKRIICWGIGNYFESFIDTIEPYMKEVNITNLIDNNIHMQGKEKSIKNKNIEIISFQDYYKIRTEDDVIVITTVHYNAIARQIDKTNPSIKYLFSALARPELLKESINIKRSAKKLIPSVIHYCWFGKNEIPPKDKEYIEGWKLKCPDYEIICWNEDNFDIQKNSFVSWAYGKKKWAFVSDYVRMRVLYEYGGIYLDTDVELLKSLDDLRYQYAYMGMEQSGCVASGLGMGSVAKNPVIKKIVEKYESYTQKEMEEWEFYEVNAKRESELLRQYGFKANNKYQIIKDIAIFPSEFFSPVQVGKKEIEITKNTFSIHHYHYSWLEKEEKDNIWENSKDDRDDQ